MEEEKKVDNVQEEAKVVTPTEPKKEKKGFCIASMVLGIIALVFFCIWYLSIPCGILAIIFGILGIKSKSKGMAIAGLITGSIGLVVSVLVIVFIVIFGVAAGLSDAFDDYDDSYYYRNYYRNYNLYD